MLHMNMGSNVSGLRRNASVKSILAAVRKDEAVWWKQYRYWHERWTNNDGDFHENVDKKDSYASTASYLRCLGDLLERHVK